MNRFLNTSAAVLVAFASLSCGKDEATGPVGGQLRVLFIGNSLTYTNDLPAMVGLVAAAAGESIETQSIALPNYALIDHWNEGAAQARIRSGNFDYVVLQQGPSSLQLSRDTLRLAAVLFNPVIREAGAIPALLEVWPELERYNVFPAVSESYYLAAQDVNGVFIPAGDTWVGTFNARPEAQLYGSDGYHPGLAGTYAAAVVVVSVLAQRNPESLSLEVPGLNLDRELMATIHAAAKVAIAARGPGAARR